MLVRPERPFSQVECVTAPSSVESGPTVRSFVGCHGDNHRRGQEDFPMAHIRGGGIRHSQPKRHKQALAELIFGFPGPHGNLSLPCRPMSGNRAPVAARGAGASQSNAAITHPFEAGGRARTRLTFGRAAGRSAWSRSPHPPRSADSTQALNHLPTNRLHVDKTSEIRPRRPLAILGVVCRGQPRPHVIDQAIHRLRASSGPEPSHQFADYAPKSVTDRAYSTPAAAHDSPTPNASPQRH